MSNLAENQQQDIVYGRGVIYDDITQTIGNTPLVKLSRFAQALDIQANILAKIEFFNPAGSIKDRPALAMIEAMIAEGKIKEDYNFYVQYEENGKTGYVNGEPEIGAQVDTLPNEVTGPVDVYAAAEFYGNTHHAAGGARE